MNHNTRKMQSRNPGSQAGFTLAELTVASTLIAIVMAGVYAAVSTSIRSWRGGESSYQTYEDARLTLGLLATELRNIPFEAQGWLEGTSKRSGALDALEFYTLSPPMDVETGEGPMLLKVRYELKRVGMRKKGDARSMYVLIREERLVEGPLPQAPGCNAAEGGGRVKLGRRHSFEVAGNIESFRIDYFWEPPLPRRTPATPPPPTTLIERSANPVCWGLPKRIDLALTLFDDGALDREEITEFVESIVFRGNTPELPQEIREELRARQGR